MTSVLPVEPVNLVANSNLSIATDTATAARNYNVHQHNSAIVPDFTAYSLSIGDAVYAYGSSGEELFPLSTPAVIDFITPTALRVSQSSSLTLTNTILYIGGDRLDSDALLVRGVSLEEDSQLITFSPTKSLEESIQRDIIGRRGFISPSQLETLLTVNLSFNLITTTTQTAYCVVPYLGFNAWLKSVHVWCESGLDYPNFTICFSDGIESLESIVEDITPVPNTTVSTSAIAEDIVEVYPTTLNTKPLVRESKLFVIFNGSPVNGTLTLSLVLNKVIYEGA